MYLQSRHRGLDLQMPTRGRVAPKLACVQDIRPHVPELGCTSAVQNEKYIFIFVLLSATPNSRVRPQVGNTILIFMYLQSSLDPRGDASPIRLHLSGHFVIFCHFGVRCPRLASYFYSWYSCICKSRLDALTCKCRREDASPPRDSLRSRH